MKMAILRWHPTGHAFALLAFLLWFIILVFDVRHWGYRDPGSVFFDPERAFERQYSHTREAEAESYIDIISQWGQQVDVKATPNPSLCVGITTVQREWSGDKYFRRLMGSLLAGLTPSERQDIYLLPFIASYDEAMHSSYGEEWLDRSSDRVLTYENAPDSVRDHVQELEKNDPDFEEKPLFDYSYLLRHAYDLGTPYVVMLEDDTIAADGWYNRTKEAIATLEEQRARDFNNTLYLRLFYNERLLGWNSEEWPSYIMRIIMLEVLVLATMLLAIFFIPGAASIIGIGTVCTIMLLIMPMFIALYFTAGRLTVAPPSAGLSRMDNYGCCSQALVFPRDQIPPLIEFFEREGSGQIDELIEIYANENGLARYALTPSMFAHVGSRSSKETFLSAWGRSNTQNIWNFSFELLDREKLKDDHL